MSIVLNNSRKYECKCCQPKEEKKITQGILEIELGNQNEENIVDLCESNFLETQFILPI